MSEYNKIYETARKCYRNTDDVECKKDEQCGWYKGYIEKFCYPKILNQNNELTQFSTTNEYAHYKDLVKNDEERDKILVEGRIEEIIRLIENKIRSHRLINNFLHYLTMYEGVNLLDNKTLQGTILLLLLSSINNTLKENKIEITADKLVPIIIDFINNIRIKYTLWLKMILDQHREILKKTYTYNNLSTIDQYFTNDYIDAIFNKDKKENLTFNKLREDIGDYIYDVLYERTLGQKSYLTQGAVGTIQCGLRLCTSVDLKQIIKSKLFPLFGLESDSEFLQYIYDTIKPRFVNDDSKEGQLYEAEYNQFINELNNKIKNVGLNVHNGGNCRVVARQYLKNKKDYITLRSYITIEDNSQYRITNNR